MKENPRSRGSSAFTLVELMVSLAIVVLLTLMLVQMTTAASRTWTYTTGKIEEFRTARDAFEAITRRLSQACLNTYWDYDNTNVPKTYVRQSELRFISGPMNGGGSPLMPGNTAHPTHGTFFQAPIGLVDDAKHATLDNLLNTWGYYVEFGDDSAFQPPFLNGIVPKKSRFRLLETMVPTEAFDLYQYTSGADSSGNPFNLTYKGHDWFTGPIAKTPSPVRVLAENVIALVLLPKLTPREDPSGIKLAPTYSYDSTASKSDPAINPKNQLPPVVQVTIIAVDDASYSRIQTGAAMPDLGMSGLFQQAALYDASTNAGSPGDLETLQTSLTSRKLRFRVFSTNVAIRAAKWSREQAN